LKEYAEKEAQAAEQKHLIAQQDLELALKDKEISTVQSKAKSQFFASMSHEFRTPLTAILGYSEIAKNPQLSDTERIDHLHCIKSSADHMLQLINDVLDLSKIEAQKMDVEELPVNLFELAEAVDDFIWILASQKSLLFEIKFLLPLPETFISDPTRLKQALVNLCSNSVKFTKSGGVFLTIACDRNTEKLIFEVKDTGVGMKPEQVRKLFQAFTQVDSSTSRNFGGTGLGLHLSKLIANKLGGDITVESEYNKGSVFIMSVNTGDLTDAVWVHELQSVQVKPKALADVVELKPSTVMNSSDLDSHPLKVLLADDNLVNQKLVGFQLKQLGAEVVFASDGLEAIASVIRDDVSVIFMDMDMPSMDGLTAVRYLRDKGFDQPIYALTGNVDEESISACREAGCNGHLAKPIDALKLEAALSSARDYEKRF
jgi:CheY-like chemotaxis protein